MATNGGFQNEGYYHTTNYGVDKKLVFLDKKDLDRFIALLDYYRYKDQPSRFSFRKRETYTNPSVKPVPMVEIIAYSMMPDHFHILLKQVGDNGVSAFLSKLTNSYTKYFNARYKRVGSLFRGTFKSSPPLSMDQVVSLSAFIHKEPVKKGIVLNINKFPFSSFQEYAGLKEGFCRKDEVLAAFDEIRDYQQFIFEENPHEGEEKAVYLE